MKRPLANDTDHFKLGRAVRAAFTDQCDLMDDHELFRSEGGRHFQVEVYGSDQPAMVSVRRLAYALKNPNDHVAEDEEVWTTCEHKGNPSTGDGTCVAHLRKVTHEEAVLVRGHALLAGKLKENK